MTGYEIAALRTLLSAETEPILLSNSLLDITLISRFGVPRRLFSKSAVYNALQGKVPMPEHYCFELPQKGERPDCLVSAVSQELHRMLGAYGECYLKSSTGSGGQGLIKLLMTDSEVKLLVPANRREIIRGLSGLFDRYTGFHDDFVRYSGSDLFDSREIVIPIMRRMADQPSEKILRTLVKHALAEDKYVLVAPIRSPLYNGRTWEIRNIMQCPGGKPQVTAQYARIGADEHFSNVQLGGRPEAPEVVVASFGQSDDFVKSYMKANDALTLDAALAFNDYMHGIAIPKFNGLFDPEIFYPREFAVDVMAEHRDGELVPVLNEIQYPPGTLCYFEGLRVINPDGLRRLGEVRKRMLEEDLSYRR